MYLLKYDILRRKYRNAEIPDYNIHTPLYEMKTTYDSLIRKIHLDRTSETYRRYLSFGFMAVELLCTKVIGINLSGFTQNQMAMIHEYDELLIELGEKSYDNKRSKLPVEVRLLGFIIFQAGTFYIMNLLTGSIGANMTSLFNNINQSNRNHPPPKRKRYVFIKI